MRGATRVDGNAIAGLLSEAMAGDVTVMVGVCGGCGDASVLAEASVEQDDTGAIVLCRACTMTLFTILRESDGVRLIFGSLRELRTG